MKILIVDDEEKIRKVIREYAQFEGYEVFEAIDGLDAIKKCRSTNFDILIMDVMMPNLDGFSAVKEIRKSKNIPVIMLSARGEEYDKLFGFEIGIDDYVVKPFSPKEVIARVNAIMLRVKSQKEVLKINGDKYISDGIEVDISGKVLYIDGKKTDISPKEYDLLLYFIANKNIALSRESLLSGVWGFDFCGEDRTIDTHVKTLRSRLGKYRNKIITLRGMGYKFEE
ncbi:MAG: response regulator transcription factor [Clostridia bacterium]